MNAQSFDVMDLFQASAIIDNSGDGDDQDDQKYVLFPKLNCCKLKNDRTEHD